MALDQVHAWIAHEIGHAWRDDNRIGEAPEDCEVKTCELAQQWDFTGDGADPERQRRLDARYRR